MRTAVFSWWAPGGASADDDSSWAQRYAKGEVRAFEWLVKTYADRLYAYILRSGVPQRDAADVLQDALFNLHRGAKSYDPNRALKTWVYTITANLVRSYFRKKRPVPGLDELAERESETPGPDALYEVRDLEAGLNQAIVNLPETQRALVLLVSVEGLKVKDAATTLSIPLSRAKTELRRGRMRLAEHLQAARAEKETSK